MTRPHIPPSRVDAATLPPLLSTRESNSFARFTFEVRDPRILQDLETAPYLSPDLKNAFKKFRAEVLQGVIQPLREDAPDIEFWQEISRAYIGHSWFDVPWYWAESYFYRRILEIVGYFQIGAWHERDPFAPLKNAELQPDVAPKRLSALLQALPDEPVLRFELLLYAALWGNRVDLSYNVEQKFGRAQRLEDERANLLVDDAPRVWEIFSKKTKQLVYVTDNAGTELAHDLAFIDHLLSAGLVEKISLHLKPQPFYVSDAMPQDVERTLTAFEKANNETRGIAERLRAQMKAKHLDMRVHWFYPTPLHYYESPEDLFTVFRSADFVILKGDVNYRRLVGDAHWSPTIAFDYTTRYFPKPFVALRTMKSDPIVGLSPGLAEELSRVDKDWRVNGKRGVVQVGKGALQ